MSGRCVESRRPFRDRVTTTQRKKRRAIIAPDKRSRRLAQHWRAVWALQLREPLSAIGPGADYLWTVGLHGWLNAIDSEGRIHYDARVAELDGVLAAPTRCGDALLLADRSGTLVVGRVREADFEARLRLALGGSVLHAPVCHNHRSLISAGTLISLSLEEEPGVDWVAVAEGKMLAPATRRQASGQASGRASTAAWWLPTSTGELWGFADDGKATLRWPLSAASARPVLSLDDGGVASGDDLGSLIVFEADGSRRFRTRFKGRVVGGPTLSGQRLWVGTSDGVLGHIGLDGSQPQRWSGGSPVSAGPLTFDDGVIVGFRSGILRRFDQAGRLRFTLDLGDEITDMAHWKGKILVSTARGRVIAFTPERFSDTT